MFYVYQIVAISKSLYFYFKSPLFPVAESLNAVSSGEVVI